MPDKKEYREIGAEIEGIENRISKMEETKQEIHKNLKDAERMNRQTIIMSIVALTISMLTLALKIIMLFS